MNKNTVIVSEHRERGNPEMLFKHTGLLRRLRLLAMTIIIGILSMNNAHASDRVLNITEHTTPARITLWHVEDNSLPIITMHFAFKGAGAINDPADKVGLGQLVSNTLDEGAGDRDAKAFQEALENHAIDLSFRNTRDNFTGKIKTLKRHQDLAFELLYDALHTPRFDEEAINRMRASNIMRIQSSRSKQDWMAARLMNAVYFGNHPYARNSGGTISGLENITAEDMRNFVETNLTKGNLVVSTAGNLTADEATTLVDKIFADLPNQSIDYNFDPITPLETPVKKGFAMDSPQSTVQMIWPAISMTDPDFHAMRVMNHILGSGGFSSMLMEEIREQRGLTYGIYSQPVNMDYADYMVIQSAMSPENIETMMPVLADILDQLKTQDVDVEVLNDAKNYLIGSIPLRFASTLSLSGAAIRMQLDGRPIDALDTWGEKINAVTVDDIKRVATRIFANPIPTAMVVSGAVPEGQGYDMVETITGIE